MKISLTVNGTPITNWDGALPRNLFFFFMDHPLVTRDEMGPLDAQELATFVNGERRQSAPLRDLIFDVPAIIEAITRCVTLEPGDLIATGTPAGVGIGFKPPRYLAPGDVVRVTVSGIGALENPIV